jgi:hypothetical protein
LLSPSINLSPQYHFFVSAPHPLGDKISLGVVFPNTHVNLAPLKRRRHKRAPDKVFQRIGVTRYGIVAVLIGVKAVPPEFVLRKVRQKRRKKDVKPVNYRKSE